MRNYNILDDKVVAFEEILLEQINKFIPRKIITLKSRDKIWFTDELRQLYKHKIRLYRTLKLTPSSFNQQRYDVACVSFIEACDHAKKKYFKKINSKISNSSKAWSSLVKHTIRRDRVSLIPALMNSYQDVVTGIEAKVEILNNHFADICTWNGPQIPSSASASLPTASSSLDSYNVSYDTVCSVLNKLNPNRAAVPFLTNRMLKNLESSIAPIIVILIRQSLSSGIFPFYWKRGLINSLFKSGNLLDHSNYRPITLLPALSKVCERVVFRQLYDYLIKNKLLTTLQFGFISKDSTTSLLPDVNQIINIGIENDRYAHAVLLDFQKAFDNGSHSGLLMKLEKRVSDVKL
ncbi:unnamed protein product [Didymodactylos carnosus]|uniref:Reverse transcriptase domain-containing protein n=1 Tax=Didymodactylos carnosus TaxID=1234261 RepID=A0A8S2SIL3_9BILA|nr:unnamed protein product [Didymodactylos carnosus]CAF4225554.1 unnamed protein product [Didymodactylos carnosus]